MFWSPFSLAVEIIAGHPKVAPRTSAQIAKMWTNKFSGLKAHACVGPNVDLKPKDLKCEPCGREFTETRFYMVHFVRKHNTMPPGSVLTVVEFQLCQVKMQDFTYWHCFA